jgi:sec-independent protein translocase protein TatA
MFGIGQTELIIVMVIAILLFGSSKLPTLMRNLGRSAKEFKKGMNDSLDDSPEDSKKQDPIA